MFAFVDLSLNASSYVSSSYLHFSIFRATTIRTNTTKADTLHISDSCVKRLKEIISEGDNFRIIVEGGGCAGFQYKFNLDNIINEEDRLV